MPVLEFLPIVLVLILGGAVTGIIALIRVWSIEQQLAKTQEDLMRLRREWDRERGVPETPPAPLEPVVSAALEKAVPVPEVREEIKPPEIPVQPVEPVPAAVPAPREVSALSLEVSLGTRWIIWVGAVIFLGGVALALKYTFDNNLIGPTGRLAMGVITGVGALCVGEYFYRRRTRIPSQAFTGTGLAILYLCIFFAFQIYHLTGSGISMVLAVGVTALAVFLAVMHNALPIALLAVTGGYMSPVFLSTGENAPWALFSYVALLNLVALGAAFFRRWRVLDIFCLAGTALLYQGWHSSYYEYPAETAPALTFITLFYVMFLLSPMVYGLLRRIPEGINSLTILIGNSVFWLFCYHRVLFEPHRQAFGWVVLGQSALVFLMYYVWMKLLRQETNMARSLLGISLALLTLVIPVFLNFNVVPIAWAIQGTLLLWLSMRFRNLPARVGGLAVFVLSLWSLTLQTPLHEELFLPILNRPFGTWLAVSVCLAIAAVIVHRHRSEKDTNLALIAGGLACAALVLLCLLLTIETHLYWDLRGGAYMEVYRALWLMLLWMAIPITLFALAERFQVAAAAALAQIALGVTLFVFLYGFMVPRYASEVLFFNYYALPKMAFILLLWRVCTLLKQLPWEGGEVVRLPEWYAPRYVGLVWETTGHVALALVSLAEMVRWGMATPHISAGMAVGIVSALWALQACVLIWHGLVSRRPFRRYAGFLLFGLATGKTVLVDVFNLAAAYRIVSWLGLGLLLVIAALLYQRYSVLLLAEEEKEKHRAKDTLQN